MMASTSAQPPPSATTVRASISKGPGAPSQDLLADSQRIALGNASLQTARIDEVAFGHYARKYSIRRYWCTLAAGPEPLRITYEDSDRDGEFPSPPWAALVRFLDAFVLPRLGAEMIDRVMGGTSIDVGALELDRVGITGRSGLGRRTLPWTNVRGIQRGGDYLALAGPDTSGHGRTLKAAVQKPNVVAVPFAVVYAQRAGRDTPPSPGR
jgi:hypothetical protein